MAKPDQFAALYDADSERMVLGSIIEHGSPVDEASGYLGVDDFSVDTHRKLFTIITDLYAGGKEITTATVYSEMQDRKWIEAIGGLTYLCQLTDGMPRRGTIKTFCTRVRDKAQRRRLWHAAESAQQCAQDGSVKTAEIKDSMEETLLSINADADLAMPVKVSESTVQVLDEWKTQCDNPSEVVGLSYGIKYLDEATTGLRMAETVAVGARTSDGKTSLGAQLLVQQGRAEVPCMMFSLELKREQIMKRLWAIESSVPFMKIHNPKYVTQLDRMKVSDAALRVGTMPIYIDDQRALTSSQVVSRIRMFARRYGVKLAILDFIQRIGGTGRERDERVRIMRASRMLTDACKEEKISLVVLSQIRRPPNNECNRRPITSDFAESGAIEEDADTALLIYRPYTEFPNRSGEDEIIIGKQRNGPTGSIPVSYLGNTMQFKDRMAA